MNYQQYKELVDKELPHMNVQILTGVGNESPPGLIKMVAVQLFQAGNVTSNLAKETQHQLDHLSIHGKTDFSDTEDKAPAEFSKSGYKQSEFI